MITLSKTLHIFLLFLLSSYTLLISAEDSLQNSQIEATKPRKRPPPLSLSLILEDPFDRMINELKSLDVSNGVDPWCQTIANYYWKERWNTQSITLSQLRDQIFASDLPEGIIHMVNRAIDRLIMAGPDGFMGCVTPPSFNRSTVVPIPHVTWDNEHSPQKKDRCPTPFAPLSSVFDSLLFESGENTPLEPTALKESELVLPKVLEIIVKQKPLYAATRTLPAAIINQHLQKI